MRAVGCWYALEGIIICGGADCKEDVGWEEEEEELYKRGEAPSFFPPLALLLLLLPDLALLGTEFCSRFWVSILPPARGELTTGCEGCCK